MTRKNGIGNGRAIGQRGSALLIVFVMAAMIAIMLYKEMPVSAFEAERQKEQLLVDRGGEYQMAVKRFYAKTRSYPPSLEALEKTNQIRFLRSRYKDPLTGKDDWRILHTNGQVLTDSKVTPFNQLTANSTGSGFGQANGNSGTGTNSGFVSGSSNATGQAGGAFGGNNRFGPSNGAFGGGPNGGNSTFGNSSGNSPGNGFGGSGISQQNVRNSGANGQAGQAQAPVVMQLNADGTLPAIGSQVGGAGQAPANGPFQTTLPGGIPRRGGAVAAGPTPLQQARVDAGVNPEDGQAMPGVPTEGNGAVDSEQEAAAVRALAQGNSPMITGPNAAGPGAAGPGAFGPGAGGPNGESNGGLASATPTAAQALLQTPNAPATGPGAGQASPHGTSAFGSSSFGNNSNNRTMGGGIAGVASKAEGRTIKLINDQKDFSKWEFWYDPQKDTQGTTMTPGATRPQGATSQPNGFSSPPTTH